MKYGTVLLRIKCFLLGRHKSEDVASGTLKEILRQAGIK